MHNPWMGAARRSVRRFFVMRNTSMVKTPFTRRAE
jgi:hypothetical protein